MATGVNDNWACHLMSPACAADAFVLFGVTLLRLPVKIFLLFAFSVAPLLLGIIGLRFSKENMAARLCASVRVSALIFYLPFWLETQYWLPAIPFLLISPD